jgi:Domain of unknown function (DUF1906)
MSRIAGIFLSVALIAPSATSFAPAQSCYLGFDRNDYPGDAALPGLRHTFRYAGYWLNTPPGDSRNTWVGKRALLKRYGFGFLVLFNGHYDTELKGRDAAALGEADGNAAVAAARREGFKPNVLIFLDQEEGGRLLPEQAAYILAWIDAVRAGGARAGVYCSGIPVRDSSGTISTAEDIANRLLSRSSKGKSPAKDESAAKGKNAAKSKSAAKGESADKGKSAAKDESAVRLWIADDRCPPSPGCSIAPPRIDLPLKPNAAGLIAAWQYAQSPRRAEFSAACPQNQSADGNCYAPILPPGSNTFIDLNVASSPDPSEAP